MNSALIQGALGLSNTGVGRYNYWKYKFGIDGWLAMCLWNWCSILILHLANNTMCDFVGLLVVNKKRKQTVKFVSYAL